MIFMVKWRQSCPRIVSLALNCVMLHTLALDPILVVLGTSEGFLLQCWSGFKVIRYTSGEATLPFSFLPSLWLIVIGKICFPTFKGKKLLLGE